jgi:hypothetical protein
MATWLPASFTGAMLAERRKWTDREKAENGITEQHLREMAEKSDPSPTKQ